MKKITVLGSTGSIGRQTLDVCRNIGGFEVSALAAGNNLELLYSQIMEFKPEAASISDPQKAEELRGRLKDYGVKTVILESALDVLDVQAELAVNALVGGAGLLPTLKALDKGMDVALANKETLVSCGELVMKKAAEAKLRILPVDSEHSAVFQCLQGSSGQDIEKIILTASGGPFRGYSGDRLEKVTSSDALKHPKWNMGAKISIDSATLMNKGLEVIEARWLFGVSPDKIEVLVHPQSIVHSMVAFSDGAVIAQLGEPDMRVPIQYALTWPQRVKNNFPRLNLLGKSLIFEKPDKENFPCLDIALNALHAGGLIPAVMNAANETAVTLFLGGKITFTDIPRIIESAINEYTVTNGTRRGDFRAEDAVLAGEWAERFVRERFK